MTFSEGLKTALYFAIGAVATGVEAIADASDDLIKKGEDVVAKGKDTFSDLCGAEKPSAQNPTESEK